MNTEEIVSELKIKYPGKKVIVEQVDEVLEIIVEIEPTSDNPEKSLALAVVGKSRPHYHKISTETYEAVKGELIVFVDGKKHLLKEGERITIRPNQVHYAQGNNAWFLTHSTPGWTFEDHIILDDKK